MAVETIDLGRRLGHPPSLSHGAWWTALVRQLLREPAACREFAELALRIEQEQRSDAGLNLIGKPKPGETVVVAAASGPVGSASLVSWPALSSTSQSCHSPESPSS